jgi:hypothetical protein
MTKDRGVTAVHQRVHVRHVVSYRVALSLIITMDPGHPSRLLPRVLYEFKVIEFPDYVSIPTDLDNINIILHSVSDIYVP